MDSQHGSGKRISGWLVLALWLATAIAAYFGPGTLYAERIEGINATQIPVWPSVVCAVLLLAALVWTVRWAMHLKPRGPAAAPNPDAEVYSARRRFLTGSAAVTGGVLGAAGAAVGRLSGWMTVTSPALSARTEQTSPSPRAAWDGARIERYRPLGNTGLVVSDIGIGSTRVQQNPEPVKYLKTLLERGVNYIDASPDYAPESEGIIGAAVAGFERDKLVIASKFCTQAGHVRQGESVATYMAAIDGGLKRMGLDYLDLVHVHACDSVERLMDDNLHEAFDRLKEQGKVRFLGVSTHTPNLEAVADTAIDSGRFHAMMLAYHHGAWPNLTNIIERAAQRGVGIIAMKTLKGAKHKGLADFRPEADSYTQAAFKWVLSNPSVSNLVISFYENQHIDEYLHASGKTLTSSDVAVLAKYDRLIAGTHCFQHCGACLDSCPAGIPINDVLRYRMYFEDYGDQKQAMQLYARLDKQADACLSCSAPCLGACPQGVPVRERMLGAHERLTLA